MSRVWYDRVTHPRALFSNHCLALCRYRCSVNYRRCSSRFKTSSAHVLSWCTLHCPYCQCVFLLLSTSVPHCVLLAPAPTSVTCVVNSSPKQLLRIVFCLCLVSSRFLSQSRLPTSSLSHRLSPKPSRFSFVSDRIVAKVL